MNNIEYNNAGFYSNALAQMTAALTEANIDYKIHPLYSGFCITFPAVEKGDIICHEFSYGNEDNLWESYNFPWDGDDVTGYLSPSEFIELFKKEFQNKS